MTDWRSQYEDAATAEQGRLSRATDAELLELIRRRKLGGYFAVWHILGERSPTPRTCWALYDVLLSDMEYLDRYHCATALLKLLRCGEFEAVDLSADWDVVPGNLRRLREIMIGVLGAP